MTTARETQAISAEAYVARYRAILVNDGLPTPKPVLDDIKSKLEAIEPMITRPVEREFAFAAIAASVILTSKDVPSAVLPAL